MPFKKGASGNKSGRPKGVPNKVTTQQKEAFLVVMELLEARMENSDDVIGRLSPARAAELYVNLLNYIKPKLNSNTNQNTIEGGLNITVKYDDDNNIAEPID